MLFACPDCRGELVVQEGDRLRCTGCAASYPVVRGTPILLTSDSVFDVPNAAEVDGTYYARKIRESRFKRRIRRRLPGLTADWNGPASRRAFSAALGRSTAPLTGLVVGAGEDVQMVRRWLPEVDWITTDVDLAFGPDAVADVLGLPLPDASVDAVVADQVLEHVIDIVKAGSELQRVLRPGGLLYVGIPFTYPWHGAPYDFFRVTPTGIRALFRGTEKVYLGGAMGPWSALARQLELRAVHTFRRRRLRWLADGICRLALWPLKHIDHYIREDDVATAGTLTYIGRKVDRAFTPREIVDEVREQFLG